MRQYIIIVLLTISASNTAQSFKLQNGDLIFQESCPANKENAIKQVTTSIGDYQFTHVGMVYIDSNDSIFVLEATTPQVALTPLSEYLYPEKAKDCFPISVVGRLKEQYQPLIPQALEIGFTHIGKGYDYGFILYNDMFYCSELIYEILKKPTTDTKFSR